MLTILPLPEKPGDAAALLADALGEIRRPDGSTARDEALAVFRRHLTRVQHHVREAFEHYQLSGLQSARLLAALMDGIIGALHDYAQEVSQSPPGALAVVATGGYGRGMLAPFSDIDLLFLTGDRAPPEALAAVEFTLYLMWDLGLKVGHATRTVDECIAESGADITVRTSMIDARRLAGSEPLFDAFSRRFIKTFATRTAEFITAKQAERDARHHRYGDSPFLVEPNIKEGRGGLRDLQTMYWMCRYMFDARVMGDLVGPDSPGSGILVEREAKHARRSWDFLWTVRFHLHYVAGRAEERLTFDMQPVIGARMGYTRHGRQDGVERFMRHYFLTVREVVRVTAVLEPAIVRAAPGPPRHSRRKPTQPSWHRASCWRTASCSPHPGATSAASPCKCCACCRSPATAIWLCTR